MVAPIEITQSEEVKSRMRLNSVGVTQSCAEGASSMEKGQMIGF
jgi:hypothetical protein